MRSIFAPLDVRLLSENKTDDEIYNVVQPDLIVVCDPAKVDGKGLKGSPDLAIEILSKSTAKKDKTVKKQLYEKAKVKEFWIVDPLLEYVEVYLLDEQYNYVPPAVYGNEDTIHVSLFEQLDIDLTAIFAN